MKIFKKFLLVTICCISAFGLIACDDLLNNKNDVSGIDYESYSDYALIVKNNAQKNMVLFKGEPSANQLLGGVRAGSTTKLKNNTSIFSESTDYVVYVVTEENYINNKDNLKVLDNSPYCTFYTAYNKGMTNENVYEISKLMNGSCSIIIQNMTSYNVELRNNGPQGEILGFVLANTVEQKFYLDEGNYNIYPVFRKYDKHTGEILSTYPTYSDDAKYESVRGTAKFLGFTLGLGKDTNREFNVLNWVKDIEFKPSAAYIKIYNQSEEGLKFYKSANSSPWKTSAGASYINPGDWLIFPIDMTLLGSNRYQESETVSGYRLATNNISGFYLNGEASTEVTYKAGHLYSYYVRGDLESGFKVIPLTEKVEQEDGTIVDVLIAQPYDWSNLDY